MAPFQSIVWCSIEFQSAVVLVVLVVLVVVVVLVVTVGTVHSYNSDVHTGSSQNRSSEGCHHLVPLHLP